jgi:hypothetical protein
MKWSSFHLFQRQNPDAQGWRASSSRRAIFKQSSGTNSKRQAAQGGLPLLQSMEKAVQLGKTGSSKPGPQ